MPGHDCPLVWRSSRFQSDTDAPTSNICPHYHHQSSSCVDVCVCVCVSVCVRVSGVCISIESYYAADDDVHEHNKVDDADHAHGNDDCAVDVDVDVDKCYDGDDDDYYYYTYHLVA